MGGLDAENREQLDMGTVARSTFFHLPARLQVSGRTEGGEGWCTTPLWFVRLLFHFDGRRPLTSPDLKRVKIHFVKPFLLCTTLSTPVLYS
jgi:hypothetical protein